MEILQTWHIVKRIAGNCEIIPSNEATGDENPEIIEKWGPFDSQGEAITRRIGLIRGGKCQPI
ncbi:DDE transposase family protein [Chlorogloeopsis sp. ULAP02]|uniref:DDE transposase family protein n=1 Tax=Chlorogloeopsis sp. ULAP02 TaxID=3107926 RepID=UPI0031352AD2